MSENSNKAVENLSYCLREEAQTIADTLEQAGFQVNMSVWGWKGFVEV